VTLLRHLPVVIVDCQSTGATPARGHLLELGVARIEALDAPDPPIEAHVLRLPEGETLPPAIARLTGIGADEVRAGITPADAWAALTRALTGPSGDAPPVPVVAHAAGFEERFLRDLHARIAPDTPYPLTFVCTLEVARRLHPDLPRRGLRALAGFLGQSLPEEKRARSHVAATLRVWRALVGTLEEEHGVATLDALEAFLARPAPSRRGRFEVPLARDRRLGLPDRPGVYRFLSGDGRILYVGKARSLHRRVNSYYRKRRMEEKLLELVSQVRDLSVTETGSALEAAVLEHDEIKRHAPPYNAALRDRGGVWFHPPGLGEPRPVAGPGYGLGPLPGRSPFDELRLLLDLIETRGASIDPPLDDGVGRRLGLVYGEVEEGAVTAGVAAFAAELPGWVWVEETGPAPRLHRGRMWLLGLERLRRRREERRAAEEEAAARANADTDEPASVDATADEAPTDTENEERAPLDADGVREHLDQLLMHGARLRRRARWLALLVDATLSWTTANDEPRRLRIERGRLVPGDDPTPPSPRCHRSRLGDLDRAGYDRLRVLTTELRRVLAADRAVEVHLSTGGRLDAAALRRILEDV